MSNLDQLFEALSGRRIPGGCDDCCAWQEMTRHETGVYVIEISHDDTCPFLAQHQARREAAS